MHLFETFSNISQSYDYDLMSVHHSSKQGSSVHFIKCTNTPGLTHLPHGHSPISLADWPTRLFSKYTWPNRFQHSLQVVAIKCGRSVLFLPPSIRFICYLIANEYDGVFCFPTCSKSFDVFPVLNSFTLLASICR